MNVDQVEPAAIIETRLVHKVHRAATSLLADAADRSPLAAVAELRDFLVATLHHHHESEDHLLFPRLASLDPPTGARLAELDREHDMLDMALNVLAAMPVRTDLDRPPLADAAVVVRNLVHRHLEHEEPILFPALRDYIPDTEWADFSRAVIASAPRQGAYFMFGFLDQVGTADEIALVLAHLPEPIRIALPAVREVAAMVLDRLAPRPPGRGRPRRQ